MPSSVHQYVEHPVRCPYCDSTMVLRREIDFQQDYDNRRAIEQHCSCLACHGRWRDVYRLDRYITTHPPEKGA